MSGHPLDQTESGPETARAETPSRHAAIADVMSPFNVPENAAESYTI